MVQATNGGVSVEVTKIRKETFKHIEKEIQDYHWTKKYIKRRREEIMNPFNDDVDENVGSSGTSEPGRPTERIATKMMTDVTLRNMEEIIDAIDHVWYTVSEDHREVIQAKYWNGKRMNWDGVAMQVNMHRNTAMKLRKEVVMMIAEKIGWR